MCPALLNTWTSINGNEVLVRHPWPQPAPAVPGGGLGGASAPGHVLLLEIRPKCSISKPCPNQNCLSVTKSLIIYQS